MLKKITCLILCFITTSSFGVDCVKYKKTPKITVENPVWTKTVMLSDEPMDEYHGKVVSFKLHGTTQANWIEAYQMYFEPIPESGGYCVRIKSVYANIGYDNFDIKIDKSHKKDSCAYNAVLAHEQKHVDAYLSVIHDLAPDIENSVYNAVNSAMPIYVDDISNVDSITELFNKNIQNHPEMVLLRQKAEAAQEIRNKRVDQEEDHTDLKKCGVEL